MIASPPRRKPSRTIAAAVCTALAIVLPARADQITLTPLRDNTIFSESNSLSNGPGGGLFAGNTNNGATRRALLAFDVAGSVPAGSTITGAQLGMRVTMSIAGSQTVTLHRLLADWGESTSNASGNEGMGASAKTGDATWRFRFFNSDRWGTNGGDFVGAISAFAVAPNTGAVTWGSTAEMVADVQAWLDTPVSNFGWILIGNEGHDKTAKRFASREQPTPALRPQLRIDFQPPVATTTPTPTTAAPDTPTATAVSTNTPTAPGSTATLTATAAATVTETPIDTVVPTPTMPPSTPSVTATDTSPIGPTPTITPSTPLSTPTPTATLDTATFTPTSDGAAATFTPTPPPLPCAGDCDGNGIIAINELIVCVNIALGVLPPSTCPACDPSGNGTVEINELIAAVNGALSGCVGPVT